MSRRIGIAGGNWILSWMYIFAVLVCCIRMFLLGLVWTFGGNDQFWYPCQIRAHTEPDAVRNRPRAVCNAYIRSAGARHSQACVRSSISKHYTHRLQVSYLELTCLP